MSENMPSLQRARGQAKPTFDPPDPLPGPDDNRSASREVETGPFTCSASAATPVWMGHGYSEAGAFDFLISDDTTLRRFHRYTSQAICYSWPLATCLKILATAERTRSVHVRSA